MSRRPRRGTSSSHNAVILGLQGAGKKTLLKQWRDDGKIRSTGQMMGANMDVLPWNGTLFSYEGTGARPFLRVMQDVSVILFLVASDANPRELAESRDLLMCVVSDPRFANARVLVACNKQDVDGAASRKEVSHALKLAEMDHDVKTFSLSAWCGFGVDRLFEALLPGEASLCERLYSPRARGAAPMGACRHRAPSALGSERRQPRRPPKGGPYPAARSRGGSEGGTTSSSTLRWQKAGRKIHAIRTVAQAGMEKVKVFMEDDFDDHFRDILDKAIDIAEESTLHGQMAMFQHAAVTDVLPWKPPPNW